MGRIRVAVRSTPLPRRQTSAGNRGKPLNRRDKGETPHCARGGELRSGRDPECAADFCADASRLQRRLDGDISCNVMGWRDGTWRPCYSQLWIPA